MPKLILIKHAKPRMDPAKPSHEWPLSEEGRRACEALARVLAEHKPEVVVTSEEPKAAETGKLVSEAMGVPFEGAPGLEEHDRGNVPVMPTKEFISSIALFFKKRDELVLGKETAAVALDRITRAIDTVQQRHAERNIAVVTHGTVLALFEASHTDADPFLIWRRMGLPSFVVFETPGMTRVGGVDRV